VVVSVCAEVEIVVLLAPARGVVASSSSEDKDISPDPSRFSVLELGKWNRNGQNAFQYGVVCKADGR
jgi:hypothetical protein